MILREVFSFQKQIYVERPLSMAFKLMQDQTMVLKKKVFLCLIPPNTAALSPVPAWPAQNGEGDPPSDLISCLQPGRMAVPGPIVQYILNLLAPSDSPNMKS